MEQRAAQDGLTFRMGDLRSGNTRDAHRLLHLAKDAGRQADLVERLHRGYFTDHLSIFDHAVADRSSPSTPAWTVTKSQTCWPARTTDRR